MRYTAANPPPAGSAPPGTQWMLNPTTGEFEAIGIGQMPPWGAIASQPGTPPPTTTGGNTNTDPYTGYTGGTGGYGGDFPAFNSSLSPRATFAPLPEFNAPRFEAPPPFVYDKKFGAPTVADLTADPSFQFRLDQGRKALEQSAAGKGVLRTGGTLKDLMNYGQNFASNEYGNVYNRKFNEYKFDYDKEADIYSKNYGVSRDVFDRNYRAAYDEFQPKMTGWQTNANADQRAAESLFERDWQKYVADRTYDLDKKKLIFDADEEDFG